MSATLDVKSHCEQKGISLLELADKSGLDLPKLRAIFQNRWTPSAKEREKIAAATGIPPEDIAWGHETPIQHIYGHGPG
jgi:transcriptional regulator with XRE-family HTH domain